MHRTFRAVEVIREAVLDAPGVEIGERLDRRQRDDRLHDEREAWGHRAVVGRAATSVTLAEGEDIVTLSHWLGHEAPTIALEHYARFLPKSGAKGVTAVNRLPTLLSQRAIASRIPSR
ncbi:hypothetical protein ACFYY1_12050 [Streptomyces sp. NPDC001890]|uniref:hypothetical protein n=1 Tax=Streptomyces sp. NPDC001890 TaxID=3364620 RepID=UPI0036C43F2D